MREQDVALYARDSVTLAPQPVQPIVHPEKITHRLGLTVEYFGPLLSPLLPFNQGVVVYRTVFPRPNQPMASARDVHNTGLVVQGGLCRRDEKWKEQLGEIKVAKDIGPKLQVVSVLGYLVDWRSHDARVVD